MTWHYETPSGLLVSEHRASEVTPNPNDPASVPPATVGGNVYRAGDPHGLGFIDGGAAPPWPRSTIVPSPWSGWPAEWATPLWNGQTAALTDTAWSCLDLNSSVLATMPPYLVGASDSLPTDWINNPDPAEYPSWHAFLRQAAWDYQLGEAFILATARYANTYPARFHVVPPWMVNVEMSASGREYRIGSIDVTRDILHIPYQITVGEAHGHGPLEAGRARVIAALVLTRYATNVASSGGVPNAVLTHPDELDAAQAADLQARWVQARMSSMGLPAVLSGGVTFEALQLSPQDMALVDLAKFNESRIAILLGVPPFLQGLPSGGDSMTYSNVQQLLEYHWRAGLSTKAHALMSALSGWLLPRGTTVELNRDEYVKPALLERAQAYQTLYNILDPTTGERAIYIPEIREAERFSVAAPSDTLTVGVLQ